MHGILTRALVSISWWTAALIALIGCAAQVDSGATDDDGVGVVELALLGDHLSGVGDDEFENARAVFAEEEDVDEGVGPIFNDVGCGNCHNAGALGGASAAIERRFGRFKNGRFDPLENKGGSLRQLQTLGSYVNANGTQCYVDLEVEPAEANVRNVGRLSTALFGLGLVDAMPDSFFTDLASRQPKATRGIANVVRVLLPDPSDPDQSIGSHRVGRFGWKSLVPSLVQFAASAYFNEMGITTQHCFDGQSVETFAVESAPNGVRVEPEECEDNILGTDEPVGECAASQTEIQEDVAAFALFMTFLAPAARDRDNSDLEADDDNAPQGRRLFDQVGCGDCHIRQAFKTPRYPTNGVPGGFKFFPFSDFLVHDMGDLGDRIGVAGDNNATTRRMRTAPLWGIRHRPLLLHDGRTDDIAEAVAFHDGQGKAAAKAFRKLSSSKRRALVNFVKSL
jgi:CxxC motif-containing protein (DUF1111 family)